MTEHNRALYVGSSDISGILGISPWQKPVDVWLNKIDPKEEDSKAKKRGRRKENYILDYAQEDFGLQITGRNVRVYDHDVKYFTAQIDGVTASANVEAKSARFAKAGEWGDDGTDELPNYYIAGCQWGLGLIPEVETCIVVAEVGDDLRKYDLPRDNELIRFMRDRADEFWRKYVVPKVRPPMEYDEHAVEVFKRIYPGTDGKVLQATPELQGWRDRMEEALALEKDSKREAAAAKAHLLEFMGEAALLNFSDGKSFRRQLTERRGYTVEATKYMDCRFVKTL